MSERWEKSIQDWYTNSGISGLQYLDLAETQKPTNRELSHNITVIYDRLSLHSRVLIKHQSEVKESLQRIEQKVDTFDKEIKSVKRLLREIKPLSEAQILTLVEKISARPKEIEAEAVRLSKDLEKKLSKVEVVLTRLEKDLVG